MCSGTREGGRVARPSPNLSLFLLFPWEEQYPVGGLLEWLQVIGWCLPSAATFEGMRAVLFDGVLRVDLAPYGCLLNGVWTLIASLTFLSLFKSARRHGLLLQVGE